MRHSNSVAGVVFLSGVFLLCLEASLRADPVEERVNWIRARYAEIEDAKLKSRSIEFESRDEPISGTCTLHFQGEEVVKVHLAYGAGDHESSDEYFYYSGGIPFFIYVSNGYWRFTGGSLPNGEGETIDVVVEHRLYLEEGRIIRHLRKEAQSKNPAALKGLLVKAQNHASDDAERAQRLVRRGHRANTIRNADDAVRTLMEVE